MSDISIANVITVTVSTPPAGLSDFQVNNLAIFSKETPENADITAAAPGIYKSPTDVLADWGSESEVYAMAVAIFSQEPNILDGGGQLIICPIAADATLATAVPALQILQPFYGALYAGYAPNDAEILAAAPIVEQARIKLFVAQNAVAAMVEDTGVFDLISELTTPHVRMLLYTTGAEEARLMAAAYAARAMCVDFNGSATTNTMHLKQLTGISADTGLSQANLDRAQTLGVDVYVPIAGRASVFCSGANEFFDNVYNQDWLVFALQVAGFNALALTGTKLPQTEEGMAVLRGAYIDVIKRAVNNSYVAPGTWNSPELFGNPADLRRNIEENGWYIYSQPVNQQAQTAREARQAPVVQIAVKLAGAIHSSAVVVHINE